MLGIVAVGGFVSRRIVVIIVREPVCGRSVASTVLCCYCAASLGAAPIGAPSTKTCSKAVGSRDPLFLYRRSTSQHAAGGHPS